MMIRRNHDEKGASIAEAVTGLVVLVPIVLILIDISAIVLTQTANDDLAKHAARLAAGQSTAQLRQAAATSVVNNYPPSTMCSNPSLVSYSEPNNAQQVKVSTSMVCNLPVQVPFGGPTQQQFTAFATEPIVSSLQTANTGNAAPAVGTNSWGQQDDLGYVNVHLQTGQGGNPQAIGPLIPNVGEFQGGSGTTGGWNGGGSGTSSNSGSGSGSGSGSSGPIQVGPIKGGGGHSSGSGSSSSGSGSSSSGSGSSSSGSGSSSSGSGSSSSGSGSTSSGSGSTSSGSGSTTSGTGSTSSGPIP